MQAIKALLISLLSLTANVASAPVLDKRSFLTDNCYKDGNFDMIGDFIMKMETSQGPLACKVLCMTLGSPCFGIVRAEGTCYLKTAEQWGNSRLETSIGTRDVWSYFKDPNAEGCGSILENIQSNVLDKAREVVSPVIDAIPVASSLVPVVSK